MSNQLILYTASTNAIAGVLMQIQGRNHVSSFHMPYQNKHQNGELGWNFTLLRLLRQASISIFVAKTIYRLNLSQKSGVMCRDDLEHHFYHW